MRTHKYLFAVEVSCQTLQVSRSCFYAWTRQDTYQQKADYEPEEKALKAAFMHHKQRYGVKRLVAELEEEQIPISFHLTRKIMQKWGLKAI